MFESGVYQPSDKTITIDSYLKSKEKLTKKVQEHADQIIAKMSEAGIEECYADQYKISIYNSTNEDGKKVQCLTVTKIGCVLLPIGEDFILPNLLNTDEETILFLVNRHELILSAISQTQAILDLMKNLAWSQIKSGIEELGLNLESPIVDVMTALANKFGVKTLNDLLTKMVSDFYKNLMNISNEFDISQFLGGCSSGECSDVDSVCVGSDTKADE